MGHDATKVLMGATRSNIKEVTNYVASDSTFLAGQPMRLKSDGTISKAKADGALLGVSLGKDLANAGRVACCRKGVAVPILLKAAFTPTVGAQVLLDDTTGLATGDGTNTGVNAVYATSTLTGVQEDGTTANVALIDFPGGL